MYFDSPRLKSVLLSVHLPLRDAIAHIDADDIVALAQLTSREYERLYGQRPRIAVAGVNPHAGEGGKFGDEERVIEQAVARARDAGLTITGPHPADTIFLAAHRGQHDVVLAMYHDQALIPIKTMAFDESVNVTIGLPYLRVSVDHGTAFDIAGRGIADATPMRYAIRWAAAHAGSYTR
jgi:4-hydroxythreonine-4-phosphate dehydrogenase